MEIQITIPIVEFVKNILCLWISITWDKCFLHTKRDRKLEPTTDLLKFRMLTNNERCTKKIYLTSLICIPCGILFHFESSKCTVIIYAKIMRVIAYTVGAYLFQSHFTIRFFILVGKCHWKRERTWMQMAQYAARHLLNSQRHRKSVKFPNAKYYVRVFREDKTSIKIKIASTTFV